MGVIPLNQFLRVRNDTVGIKMRSKADRARIHGPSDPDRQTICLYDHDLRHIERPGVEAGQPVHVGRIADNQCIQFAFGHRRLNELQTIFVFGLWERWWHFLLRKCYGSVASDLGQIRGALRNTVTAPARASQPEQCPIRSISESL